MTFEEFVATKRTITGDEMPDGTHTLTIENEPETTLERILYERAK